MAAYLNLNDTNISTSLLNLNNVEDKRSITTRGLFDDCLNDFKLNDKVVFVVTDNAPDVKSAFRDGMYVWLGCSAHQLQLCLKHAIEEIRQDDDTFGDINELVKYTRDLVSYVNQSNRQKLFKTTLKQESNVRFDSLYLMLDSVLRNADVVDSIEDEQIRMRLGLIDFDLLAKITCVLKLFYDKRGELSATKRSTINLVWPSKLSIEQDLDKVTGGRRIKKFAAVLKSNLKSHLIITKYHKMATYLTPFFKRLENVLPANTIERIKNHLKDELQITEYTNQENTPTTSKTSSNYSSFANLITGSQQLNSNLNEQDVIEQYDSLKFCERDEDVLEFWNRYENNVLSNYAKQLLGVPATTVPVESFFSQAGFTLNKHRNRLNADKTESCLFLKSNSDLVFD